ncbi:SET (Su(var)3-9, Enhancer-of-zeste, Trithorax) domain [Teratosphaeria destructans]|uniref:SET (Su(Var)3-9, Enhancer-of-zeste, Trithorax) domain n=1 Tax=Teratosphaeria destructans TaxID=418781 RepID=A0A9W7SSW3_9PEZI|nr:SET (Su(var)3-9, Enhancer-of-zeste, Trithorax) domain [Teratosphaeria destructans]
MAQHCEDGGGGTLRHIYFFLSPPPLSLALDSKSGRTSETASAMSSPVRQDSVLSGRSETGSDDGSESDSRSLTNSTSSSGARLNPLAQDFVPSSEKKHFDNRSTRSLRNAFNTKNKIEVRATEDKGFATFATKFIAAGSCILKEHPLMVIKGGNFVSEVYPSYCQLDAAARAKFDRLHCFKRDIFEQTARIHVLGGDKETTGDVEAFISEQVRVMSTFACNVFGMSGLGQGICYEASRFNHSCRPNAHHSYNPNLKKEVIYAIRDIQPGEEICLNYMGGGASYQSNEERRERLFRDYGFYCTCPACMEPFDGQSNGMRGLLNVLVAGYSAYISGEETWAPAPAVPTDPASALAICEEIIRCFLTEGLTYMELAKAYRSASTEAASLDMPDKAFEYAMREAEVERTCLGDSIEDLVKCGAATSCWVGKLKKQFGGSDHGGHGPNRIPQRFRRKKKSMAEKKTSKSSMEKKAKQAAEAAAARETRRAEAEAKREELRRKMEYDAKFPALRA